MNKQETILVVGGAGYIGSVTVQALIERGYRAIVADNLENGHRQAVPREAEFETCDMRNSQAIASLLKKHTIDAVLHFGAYAYVGESMQKAEDYFHNNFIGGFHLLNAMRAQNVGRIVFSSTCATYGAVTQAPITEEFHTNPINPYGRSKLAFEYLLRSYEESYGLRFAALRYFNAAGATPTLGEDHKPETHLIPLVLQVALEQRESITIFGTDYNTPDGTCIRDYIHVSDLADAHIRALDYIKNQSITCNLGTGRGYSVREVIETAREITSHPIPAVEAPRRPGDPAELIASPQKAHEALGWSTQHSTLQRILESAWQWHRRHPHGYEDA
ncbi:UDP-glucose 4-epimerase GalE [bacterium]|nr:UDP-glucose 4-epimerase GalE [bacterium]